MTKKDTTQSNGKKQKKGISLRLIITAMWGTFAFIVVGVALFFVLIANGVIGYMPDMEELENPIDVFASQVISADGELLFTYSRGNQNRIFVDFTDLSPYLIDALIATEDIRFRNHSGIDIRGLGRAVVLTGILQRDGGGGSTISQQLAKQLYSPRARNIWERIFHKLNEWVIAVRLERFYSKDEIINLYLNMYDFGNNAIGIESAARTYFNTTPGELNIQQSAMLIGMLQNSSRFNPNRFYDRTRGRRNVVLSQMQRYGFITRQEFDSLRQTPLDLEFRRMSHIDIPAPYLRQELWRRLMAREPDRRNVQHAWQMQQFIEDSIAWATDPLFGWAHKQRHPNGTPRDIFTGGYRIFVTIDSRMQRYAEEAVTNHLRNTLQPAFDREQTRNPYRPFARSVRDRVPQLLQTAMRQTDRFRLMRANGISEDEILRHFNEDLVEMNIFSWEHRSVDTLMTPMDSIRHHKQFLRAGFMAMDPVTGHVKAYVGGPDFRFFQFDMVSTGKRQVGSITKPFVYALAMEDELITACDEMFHQPIEFEIGYGQPPWRPRSVRQPENAYVTFQWGMDRSCNWVAAYLMGLMGQEASPHRLAQLLTSLGLRTAPDPVLSLVLGPNDASVFEMVSAYSAFANRGLRVEPVLVTRIEDAFGQVLFSAEPRPHEVFSERVSYQMVHMMQGAINAGTGGRLRTDFRIHGQIAGKTGTTNDNADGWFISFTPNLVVGAWVGGELPSIQFNDLTWGQGGRMALPMHGAFFRSIFDNPDLPYTDDGRFPMPPGFDPCAGSRFNRSATEHVIREEEVRVSGIDDTLF